MKIYFVADVGKHPKLVNLQLCGSHFTSEEDERPALVCSCGRWPIEKAKDL
jgi:hypothetical protein